MSIWIRVRRAISVYQFVAGIFGSLVMIIGYPTLLRSMSGDLLLWIALLGVFPCYAGISLWSGKARSRWRQLCPSLVLQAMQTIWFSLKGLSYWYWNIAVTLVVGRTSQGAFYTSTYYEIQPKFVLTTTDWGDLLWSRVPVGPWLEYAGEPFVGLNLVPLVVIACLLLIGLRSEDLREVN